MFIKRIVIPFIALERWAGVGCWGINWRAHPERGRFREVELYHEDPKVLLATPGEPDQHLRFAALALDEHTRDGNCETEIVGW